MSSHTVLLAHDLVKIYGDRRVLDGVSLVVSPRQRLGLVGENGSGKSTLLRLLAGEEEPDSGEVTLPEGAGLLHQELPYPGGATIREAIDTALADIRAIEAHVAELAAKVSAGPGDEKLLAAYGEALEQAQLHEVWDSDHRVDTTMAGLGLDGLPRDRQLSTLSGGQRSRLGLAALLLRRPELLLLDEPTNHLDEQAIGFLEEQLRSLPGAVVLASHDRLFLDAVCTDICDLDPSRNGLVRYGGSYSDYREAKRLERLRWEQQWRDEQHELAALHEHKETKARQVAYNRMKDNNKVAYAWGGYAERAVSRRVRNTQQRIDQLSGRQVGRPPEPLRFRSALTGTAYEARGPVASARDVRVPGRLDIPVLDIGQRTRLLVTGTNGAGKSTLLSVLARELRPARGSVAFAPGLRIGLLPQDVHFERPSRTPREIYTAHLAPEREAATSLDELGLLSAHSLGQPVAELSVGQRRRLALALLIADAPQLLLLDEPTNHISLTLAEELEEALRTAPAAVVAASHDRWLRASWAGREILLVDGTIRSDTGDPSGGPGDTEADTGTGIPSAPTEPIDPL